MTRLIKSDFKKFFQDKLFLIVCILAVIFAVITPLIYIVLFAFIGEDPMTEEILSGLVSAKGQFFSSFSFGNNLGVIAPLLIGIILCKDFSSGTVRNKIISGHSRTSILLSLFTVCFTMLFGIVLAHALLTLGISLPFFGYQPTPFEIADLWCFLESLLFEFLVYLFVAAFISWLCVVMKNMGLVIVTYIAVVFGATMIGSILQVAMMVLAEIEIGMEWLIDLLDFLQHINVFMFSANIGLGTSYATSDVLYYVLPPLVGAAALLCHGIFKFRRKDLK